MKIDIQKIDIHQLKQKKVMVGLCAAVVAVLILFICNQPRSITIAPNDTIYETDQVTEEFFTVTGHTLLGEKILEEATVDISTVSDNSVLEYEASATYRSLSSTTRVTPMRVDHIEVTPLKTLYVGKDWSNDLIECVAVYEDGHTDPVAFTLSTEIATIESDTVLQVATSYGETEYPLDPVIVKNITGVYTETIYTGETPNPQKVEYTVTFEDETQEITTGEIPDLQPLKGETQLTGETDFGPCTFSVTPIGIKEHSIQVEKRIYSGNTILPESMTLHMLYEDGEERDFTASNTITNVQPDTSYTIESDAGDFPWTFDVTRISEITIQEQSDRRIAAYDVLEPVSVTFICENAENVVIPIEEVTSESFATPLKQGNNALTFEYDGQTYSTTIWAHEETYVNRAKRLYDNELLFAEKSYITDHTFVTISRETFGEMEYYLTHIVIDSPQQIKAGMSHDTYGGERETPSSASKRQGWVVGVNASNFSWSTGQSDTTMANVVIKNGNLMTGDITNGFEVCLSANGELYSPDSGLTAETLLINNVTDTFTCGDTLLINRGVRINEGIQSLQYRYPRTAVGMVEPGEYYFLSTVQTGRTGGGTYDEIREVLYSHGCVFGKCMDGGGSSTLVFQNEVLNNPADGKERAVADFLYIVDVENLEEEDYYTN